MSLIILKSMYFFKILKPNVYYVWWRDYLNTRILWCLMLLCLWLNISVLLPVDQCNHEHVCHPVNGFGICLWCLLILALVISCFAYCSGELLLHEGMELISKHLNDQIQILEFFLLELKHDRAVGNRSCFQWLFQFLGCVICLK